MQKPMEEGESFCHYAQVTLIKRPTGSSLYAAHVAFSEGQISFQEPFYAGQMKSCMAT